MAEQEEQTNKTTVTNDTQTVDFFGLISDTDSEEEYNDDSNESSTQKPHADSPETQENLETKSQQANYFGLVDGVDSDSSSSDTEPGHLKTETKGQKNAKVSVEHCKDEKNPATPLSNFWNSQHHEVINWQRTDEIWKSESSSKEDRPTDHQHFSKRAKFHTDTKTDLFPVSSPKERISANMKLEKSCFYVHHKVAPYLNIADNSRTPNRVSKRCVLELHGHSGAVNRIKWCCTNFSHLLLSASMDRTVKVWNALSGNGTCLQTLMHHTKAVKDAKWSQDGHKILSCGYDKSSCLNDVEYGTCVQRFEEDNFVTCVDYHPVNYHIFVSGSTNQLTAWDSRTSSAPVRRFKYKDKFGQIQDIEFLRDGSEFFTCNDIVSRDSADRNVMAWDFMKGVVISNQIYQERYTCSRLRVHHREPYLLAQSQGGYIAQFSTIRPYKMNRSKRYEGHNVEGYTVGFDISPDGQMLVSGNAQGSVPFYDYRTTRVLGRINLGNCEVCLDVAWHPVLSSTIALSTWGGRVSVWV